MHEAHGSRVFGIHSLPHSAERLARGTVSKSKHQATGTADEKCERQEETASNRDEVQSEYVDALAVRWNDDGPTIVAGGPRYVCRCVDMGSFGGKRI